MKHPYSFQELFVMQLRDLRCAEGQIAPFFPTMIDLISSGELREELSNYCELVKHSVETLEQILQEIPLPSEVEEGEMQCTVMTEILAEIALVMHHGGNSAVKDAGLIALVQRAMHLKIAMYGTTRTYARHLNWDKAMNFCQRALNEEVESDARLTRIAEGGIFTTGINQEAVKNPSR